MSEYYRKKTNADAIPTEEELKSVCSVGVGCVYHRMKNGNPIVIPCNKIKSIDISTKNGSVLIHTESGTVEVDEEFGDAVSIYQKTSDRYKTSSKTGTAGGRVIGDGCVFHRCPDGNPIMIPSSTIDSIDMSYHDDTTLICTGLGNLSVTESFMDSTAILNNVTA